MKNNLPQDIFNKTSDNISKVPDDIIEKLNELFYARGNWGHKGRPGMIGGSAATGGIGSFPEDFKDITDAQKAAQANYKDIKSQMSKDLNEIQSKEPNTRKVEGLVTTKNMTVIASNMRGELSTYTAYLAGDTTDLMHNYISLTENTVKNNIDEFKDIKANDLDSLCKDNVKKLVYQEIESNRQAFTDHGIRHITKNIDTQDKILNALSDQGIPVTGKDRLLANFIMVNHDVGYTTPLIREGGLRGILASKDHPAYSMAIASEQAGLWNKGKVFSQKEYTRALQIIKTHDSTILDLSDTLALSTRISDNLALFQAEKLPSMFQYVAGGRSSISNMALAAKNKDTISFEKHKAILYKKINKSTNLNGNLRRDLKAATSKLSFMTPKFTVGVLAGNISSIGVGKKSFISVRVKYNKYDSFLQKHFDMGQKQTKKFLSDYGENDLSKISYYLGGDKNKSILSLHIDGYGGYEQTIIRRFGGKGSGWFAPPLGDHADEDFGKVSTAFNNYIDQGGTTLPRIPSFFKESIGSQSIKKEDMMSENLCYSNSLTKAKEGYELHVGYHINENVVERLLSKDPKYINSSFHAWNVKDNKVYDFTLGKNKDAYIGQKISAKGLVDGSAVRDKLFDIVKPFEGGAIKKDLPRKNINQMTIIKREGK